MLLAAEIAIMGRKIRPPIHLFLSGSTQGRPGFSNDATALKNLRYAKSQSSSVCALPTCSIFFRQHDRQHSRDDELSIWVLDIWLVIQIDLEKDHLAVNFECAEIVEVFGRAAAYRSLKKLNQVCDRGDHAR
jgi:hypothetical protein